MRARNTPPDMPRCEFGFDSRPTRRWVLIRASAIAGLAAAAGCAALGVAANALPDPTIEPKYKGLAHQTVAVMVWCDRAMSIDWPTLQLDLSRGIESRLNQEASKKDVPKVLEGTHFVPPESVIRFQHDHPEAETAAIVDIAPKMNVSRLIYLEITDFATRPEDSVELFRGSLKGNLKVIEVDAGRARIAYQEQGISTIYPENSPEEGVPGVGDAAVYEQTLDAFVTQIVNRFIPHTEPRQR